MLKRILRYRMSENNIFMEGPSTSGVAKPVHIQRLERAMNISPFIMHTDKMLTSALTSDDSSDDEEQADVNVEDDVCEDVETDKSRLYNFDSVDEDRGWLQRILLDNSEDSNDGHDEDMLFIKSSHSEIRGKRKSFYNNSENLLNQYFGCGLLSAYDMYPENQMQRPAPVAKKTPARKERRTDNRKVTKKAAAKPVILDDLEEDSNLEMDWENGIGGTDDYEDEYELRNGLPHVIDKKRNTANTPEAMLARRKKVFTNMVKKELGKQQRAKFNHHKEVLAQCKRAATFCARAVRQKALQSARVSKEQQWRIKRIARENAAYWKRYNRVDREMKRRMEKEAEEQRKMDVEFIEAKRQQRKLNFLITQTELYAHFMSKKLGKASPEEQLRILNQLDEEKNPRLASMDDYDSDVMKAKAKRNALDAFENERARTRNFDIDALNNSKSLTDNILSSGEGEHEQPAIFQGNLKGYQLRGMNWLADLYDQGISGILADEMGLGKTVQSIAFLCHVAEKYSVWGPFLIISPASTLHNWQQEMARFVPQFKVVPYWGNPTERKILRQFWDQKDMHTKDASFHVVITSYQIVITDFKYFNRIKWQYMILDEAQAIKSTSSVRWKMLLGFSCRNRLLLSGTPIQNSMAELWALLHFIMPTLFDSHDEFNEWFSKDIESHAENKTGIDEKHLSRLHMILKPFMLRRIKKDVENELSDKIEVMVYCPLTTRQKLLYMALKQKIRIEDLLHYTVGGGDSHSVDRNFTSNLMNLVMQFRKVCNHPELFERRDAKSPIFYVPYEYVVPKLVYDANVRFTKLQIILKYFIFTSELIHRMISDTNVPTIFNFSRLLNISPHELYKIFQGDILYRWMHYFQCQNCEYRLYNLHYWMTGLSNSSRNNLCKKWLLNLTPQFKLSEASVNCSNIMSPLIFTRHNSGSRVIYTHDSHKYYSMPETIEHRTIRSKSIGLVDDYNLGKVIIKTEPGLPQELNTASNSKDIGNVPLLKEILYVERKLQKFECEPTELPSFLFCGTQKLETRYPKLYCATRRAQWNWLQHAESNSWQSLQSHWAVSTGIYNIRHEIPYHIQPLPSSGVDGLTPINGWSNIMIPDKETLVTDAGKLSVLDSLLKRLKEEGHRVLIYSQMTKMIDLLEEYMWHRKHKYMRLDGSSKISERRDMVADFQARTDIFVFLLSTRAGGLGINLTAADTVIFYDSDWNPTVDQQAMDRAHRLGQTKQVTVYRLICKGSIEERILQRAREKSEIQRMVISGGNFKPDTLKPKEVVSLLLDDEEIEMKYRQRTEERKHDEVKDKDKDRERKRKQVMTVKPMPGPETKKPRLEGCPQESPAEENWLTIDSAPTSPVLSETSPDVDEDALMIDVDYNIINPINFVSPYSATSRPRVPGRGATKRGRPRGSRRSVLSRNYVSNMNYTQTSASDFSAPQSDGSTPSCSQTSSTSDYFSGGSGTISAGSPFNSSPSSSSNSGRRGPGRPRLKPGGPPNAGTRGTYRPRKPARPLPVPIHSGTSGIGTNVSSSTSSLYSDAYFYEMPEHSDS